MSSFNLQSADDPHFYRSYSDMQCGVKNSIRLDHRVTCTTGEPGSCYYKSDGLHVSRGFPGKHIDITMLACTRWLNWGSQLLIV